jgi:hypothetical protein
MSLLSRRGAEVEYHDPYVPIKQTREHSHWAGKKSVDWDRVTIARFDLVMIAANHGCVNYNELGCLGRVHSRHTKRDSGGQGPVRQSLEGARASLILWRW